MASRKRMSSAHAALLAELKGKVPPDVWIELGTRFQQLFAAAHTSDKQVRDTRDYVLHLKANCAAEEQTRVALLERQAQLEHEKSQLRRRLLKASELVEQAKSEKRAINEEIERLNKDLFTEAGKLVAEETQEKLALRADQRQIMEQHEALKSRLLLEKDRCVLAASQIRAARENPLVSFDHEESVNAEEPISFLDDTTQRKKSL